MVQTIVFVIIIVVVAIVYALPDGIFAFYGLLLEERVVSGGRSTVQIVRSRPVVALFGPAAAFGAHVTSVQ